MATNRVVFEVTDNGTLRALGAQASKAGQAMGNAAKGAHTFDRNTKGAASASSNATKNFSKMAQGSNGLVAAYATLAANVFAVSAAFNFLKSAADFRVIQDAQVAFSSATGQGMKSLTRDLQTAAKGLLSFQDAAQAASIGIASGLGADQIEALAKGAASASQILGRDVTDSFNRLVRGVTKAEPELLDELGITLRLADATEAYAATLGKRATELTQFERKQAVFNDVQTQLEEKFNRVADASEIEANAIDKLGKAFDRVLNNVKELSASLLEPVALFFAENVNALTAALGLLAIPLIKQILPGLDDWASTSKEAAKEAKIAYRASKKELEELAIAQKKITDPKASLAGAVSGVKSKGAGIQAIQAGGDLTERQRMSLLRAAEKGKGIVTQLSKDQQRVYIASLRAMGAENKKFGFSIQRTWQSIATTGKRAAKTLEVAWKGAMTRMSAATAAFARFTDKMFRAAGIIGVVLLFIDLLKVALEKLGLIRKDKALQEMRETVGDLTERLKTNNQEFANFGKLAVENQGGKIAIQNFERLGNLLSSVTDNLLAMNEALKNVGEASKVIQGRGTRKARGGGFMPGGSAAAAAAAGRPVAPAKIDLGDLGVESKEEARKTLETIRAGLESTGIDALAAGKEFKALVNTFITSGELTGKQATRFAQLSKQIQSYGALSSEILQSERDINTQYNKVISNLTTYQTKYSDLIQAEEQQIQRLNEIEDVEGDIAVLLAGKQKQLALLLKLQELEYKRFGQTKVRFRSS
jgi:polyhydroxyalkanoate synthesis regulator phasin